MSTSDSTAMLERAFATTRAILANVTPDQYDQPTTCASWTVRDVVNHVCEGANWFAMCVNAGAAPDPDPTHGFDYAAGDVMAAYDEGAAASVAAFAGAGAQEKLIKLPFGEMPGAIFMGIATNDVFVHGWDLAKSTGQATDIDPEMAGQLLAQLRMFLGDEMRGPDGEAPFGKALDAPAGASEADKLAAFLGRTV